MDTSRFATNGSAATKSELGGLGPRMCVPLGAVLGAALVTGALGACEPDVPVAPDAMADADAAAVYESPLSAVCAPIANGQSGPVATSGVPGVEEIWCDKRFPGGPWVLVSTRLDSRGILIGRATCERPGRHCSGHVPPALGCDTGALAVLVATLDEEYWISLRIPEVLRGYFTGEIPVVAATSCGAEHAFCAPLEPPAWVRDHSDNFEPRFRTLRYGYVKGGGMELREKSNIEGEAPPHGISFNYVPYDGAPGLDGGGPLFISGVFSKLPGDVVHGRTGAMYYTCVPDDPDGITAGLSDSATSLD